MQLIKKCEKYGNAFFYIALFIHIAVMCAGFSAWKIPYSGRLLQLAFLLCGIKILTTYYEKREWLTFGILFLTGGAGYWFSKEKFFLYLLVLVFSAKSIEVKYLLKGLLYGTTVSMLVVAILSLAGIGADVKIVKDFGRGMVETRYCLGFSHPNNLHGTLWYVLCIAMIIYKDRMDWRHYLGATVINIIAFMLTASRAGVAVVELMIIAGVIYRYCNRLVFEKIWPYVAGYLLFGFVVVLTLISVTVDYYAGYGPVLSKLNRITTGRINLAYQGACISNWRLFTSGADLSVTVDNGFAAIPANYGIVVGIIYILFVGFVMYKCTKQKNGVTFAIVVTCILYTFMERSYTINDAYLLSNLTVVVAMMLKGIEGKNSETVL